MKNEEKLQQQIRLLIDGFGQLADAQKLQMDMISDLKDYIMKQEKHTMEILTKLTEIWEK